MMEYVLPNILAAAEFDRTAKAIIAVGFEKTAKRFFSKVIILENGCWTSSLKPNSTGYISHKLTKVSSGINDAVPGHRLMWLISGMKISRGMFLDHKCRNRLCINPHHLREVTPKINATENNTGATAKNAAKTKCVRGHALDSKNTRVIQRKTKYNKISRSCRICELTRNRARSEKKKMEVLNGG